MMCHDISLSPLEHLHGSTRIDQCQLKRESFICTGLQPCAPPCCQCRQHLPQGVTVLGGEAMITAVHFVGVTGLSGIVCLRTSSDQGRTIRRRSESFQGFFRKSRISLRRFCLFIKFSSVILSYLNYPISSSYLILSYPILSYPVPSHPISSHLISSHFISSHLISSYRIVSYLILSYLILSYLIISHMDRTRRWRKFPTIINL